MRAIKFDLKKASIVLFVLIVTMVVDKAQADVRTEVATLKCEKTASSYRLVLETPPKLFQDVGETYLVLLREDADEQSTENFEDLTGACSGFISRRLTWEVLVDFTLDHLGRAVLIKIRYFTGSGGFGVG